MEYDTLLIDTYRVSHHPQINDAVEWLLACDDEKPDHNKYRYTLQRILVNLYLADKYDTLLSVPFRMSYYTGTRCMCSWKREHVKHAFDLLERLHLVACYQHSASDDGSGEFTRYSMTDLLRRMMPDEIVIEYDWQAIPMVVMRDGKLPDTRQAHRIAKAVGRYNECTRRHSLVLYSEPSSPLSVKKGRKTVDLCHPVELQFVTRRIFNRGDGMLRYGGRFYTSPINGFMHPQGLNKVCRNALRMDGETTRRADYKAMHISQLYAIEGRQISGDPYACIDADRDDAKLMLLIAINAQSRQSALLAFYKSRGYPGGEIYDAIVAAHPIIGMHIGSDFGIRLQRKDSDIAAMVLSHFVKRDIMCIPVHDEFIVPSQHLDELVSVMDAAYKKVMVGYSCQVEVC